jgi:hypothetical protein
VSERTLKFVGYLGDDGMTEYEWRLSKPPKGKPRKESIAERKISNEVMRFFRIYFPTHETVANSKGGIGVSLIYFFNCFLEYFKLGHP